ncbi:lytic transglycosylase domain-containing protein [Pontivivens ytuae]|uniref:Lytic transglycosylase domain-containing protein n=1 Tax=Pontivivens ytuae TaxID=2789856 RepID=A0A7S9LP38_9RHOB|nr:lytic transglycosylase domain-containing protein [Pontivivens ytuae]QPH52712.1 lytic transglycosylase domain-containing protein [Pontivivens ytuae]
MRLLPALVAVCLAVTPAAPAQVSDQAGLRMAEALRAGIQRDWDLAESLARQTGEPVAREVLTWTRLRTGDGNWNEYLDFIERNADWPGLTRMRRAGETRIPANADPMDVFLFFGDDDPQTGLGALRLAEAQAALGRGREADGTLVRAWRELPLNTLEEQLIAAQAPRLLEAHHITRLDNAIWDGRLSEAARMEPRVSPAWRALAEARIALRRNENGVNELIDAVPAELADHPGLAYDRFVWRRERGLDTAQELLRAQSTSAAELGQPEAWARARRGYARAEMRTGNVSRAYELASRHFLTEGSDYADLEWLSGYIQLRRLRSAERAIPHFQRFEAAVETPISLGRAGYWLGRAYEGVGNLAAAQAAFERGAQHQSTFYGQLAAQRLGLPADPAFSVQEQMDWRSASFANDPRLTAAALLYAADDWSNGELFLRRIALDLPDPAETVALADFAIEVLQRPDSAVRLSKFAARETGQAFPATAYPLLDLSGVRTALPPELIMSLARQESELNTNAVSRVGARGLMQLMPGTAQDVSRQLGIPYSASGLTQDPEYNIRLGTTYLADLMDRFNGSYVLSAVGYNAGPGRSRQWSQRYGDPRRMDLDRTIDWIEHIPFTETRNYVMRVIEGMHVYRQRLEGGPVPLRIEADLTAG